METIEEINKELERTRRALHKERLSDLIWEHQDARRPPMKIEPGQWLIHLAIPDKGTSDYDFSWLERNSTICYALPLRSDNNGLSYYVYSIIIGLPQKFWLNKFPTKNVRIIHWHCYEWNYQYLGPDRYRLANRRELRYLRKTVRQYCKELMEVVGE